MNCTNKYKNTTRRTFGWRNNPEVKGAYYPASILVDLEPGMEAFDNELFGPVASDEQR
jgi:acyl-CoA reductase-like NAD-dependent aldehyde dehydrogenase